VRLASSLAAALILAAAPGFVSAQTAPAAPAQAPAQAPAADEAAFEARAEAFGKTIQTMMTEMQAAAAQTDKAKAKTDLDALQARYQPEIDAFAAEVQTFASAQGATADQLAAADAEIKAIPTMVRAQIEAAAAAPAPAAPQ
jgi:hypothetical protein